MSAAQSNLFASFDAPEDRELLIDRQIMDVLTGRYTYAPSDNQRALLHLLRMRRGLSRAISIGEIGERLKLSPRTVKEEIADLTIRFRLPIGSSRDSSQPGYYLAITKEERVASATPHINQALKHLQRADVLLSKHEMAELMGQIQMTSGAPDEGVWA